jgi:hypothetical protein
MGGPAGWLKIIVFVVVTIKEGRLGQIEKIIFEKCPG